MLKKTILFALAFLLLASCKNNVETNSSQEAQKASEIATIQIGDFESSAEQYVGEEIFILGTVDHVCKHGGKRLHLVDANSDASVKIEAGDVIDKFNREIEGSDLKIKGIVTEFRIDEDYLVSRELEIKQNHEEMDEHSQEEMDNLDALRLELEESGKDHLSYFSIDCLEYEVLAMAENPVEDEVTEDNSH